MGAGTACKLKFEAFTNPSLLVSCEYQIILVKFVRDEKKRCEITAVLKYSDIFNLLVKNSNLSFFIEEVNLINVNTDSNCVTCFNC